MDKELLKKSKIIAIAILFIGASFLPQVGALYQTKTKIQENNNETTNQVTVDTEYWALLVAAAVYADDPQQNRPLMLEEVDDFYELLLESPWWSEDHIKVIKGEDATVTNIFEGLRWLDEKEDSNDISLFYITTHGFPLGYDIPPLDEADGTDEALMSFWGFAYPTNIIWDDEINFMLNRLDSFGVCMIVDSCYAGGFNDPPDWKQDGNTISTDLKTDDSQNAKDWIEGFAEDVQGQGRVVLMASCEDEVSYSGGFAPYLIDGLRGYGDTNQDGIISAEEAFYYTEPRTVRQHPTMYDGFEGELPLISVNYDSQESYEKENNINTGDVSRDIVQKPILLDESTVCGHITDAETNQPIKDAIVELLRGSYWDGIWYETLSDSAGFYSFSVEPGDMRIFAEAKGYFNTRSDYFTVNDQEIFWVNISMPLHPPENATICGFIKDEETDDPIEDVIVNVEWGHQQNRYWNETFSDSTGFYTINIASGDIELEFESSNYLPFNTDEYKIDDFEKLWINVSMIPSPVETSKLCGYVTDSSNNEPVSNAYVYLELHHLEGHRIENETSTDSNGFYSMNIPAGETYLYIYAYDYYQESTPRNDADENDILWVNVSLDEDIIALDIEKPLNAIYLNNQRIIPNSKCVIFGSIDIVAYAHDFWYRTRTDVDKVEFYIDDILKFTDDSEPYMWTWSDILLGEHTIQIIAYDDNGKSVIKEREVLKIL